jgi:PAP2 superfamily
MKAIKFSLVIATALSFISVWNTSCKKDVSHESLSKPAPEEMMTKKSSEPGFVQNSMVIYWNQKASMVLENFNPPPAQSRLFAMIQIAVHDALNSIKPKFERYALLNEREKNADPDAAVASAAYWTIKGLGVGSAFPVDNWYNESLATIPDGDSKESGKALGKKAADAIIANRANDGLSQALAPVAIPDGVPPGAYRSTLPYSNPDLGLPKVKAIPNWGTALKPFAVLSHSQFRPEAPAPVNSASYVADFNEVKAKGARVNHTRTDEETEIGFFWIEKSSIGWNRFARNAVEEHKMDAWKTARLFALMNVALIDGISGAFEAKYHFFYWRPETAIRLADDGNALTTSDPTWLPSALEIPNANPLMNAYTPPHPDYPSAHAAYGGAAAEILKLFFGTDNTSVDQTSPTRPGVIRHYSSFSAAARDNSLSRIYVGYHFRKTCLAGEEQGKQIATYIFNHSFRESGE